MRKIKIGDIVQVDINLAQTTSGVNLEVLYKPLSDGDYWKFLDKGSGAIICTNERITIIKK